MNFAALEINVEYIQYLRLCYNIDGMYRLCYNTDVMYKLQYDVFK